MAANYRKKFKRIVGKQKHRDLKRRLLEIDPSKCGRGAYFYRLPGSEEILSCCPVSAAAVAGGFDPNRHSTLFYFEDVNAHISKWRGIPEGSTIIHLRGFEKWKQVLNDWFGFVIPGHDITPLERAWDSDPAWRHRRRGSQAMLKRAMKTADL